jgi:hypothetical protein
VTSSDDEFFAIPVAAPRYFRAACRRVSRTNSLSDRELFLTQVGSMPSFSSIRSMPLSRTIAIEQKLLALIWWFYRNLLACKRGRSSCRKAQLKARSPRMQDRLHHAR